MLVIVENRDVHDRAQLPLDLETFGRLDVLEIDAAEGRFQGGNDADHAIDFGSIDLDVENIDAREFLEQHRLAFHHRLGSKRPDVAQAKHGGAVGDHGDQIGARGIGGSGVRIVANGEAGCSDTRRIGQRQVALVAKRLGGLDLEFSRPRIAMVEQRVLVELTA